MILKKEINGEIYRRIKAFEIGRIQTNETIEKLKKMLKPGVSKTDEKNILDDIKKEEWMLKYYEDKIIELKEAEQKGEKK